MGGRGSVSVVGGQLILQKVMQIVQSRKSLVDTDANEKIIDAVESAGIVVNPKDRQLFVQNFETEALGVIMQTTIDLEQEYGALEINKANGGYDKNLRYGAKAGAYGMASLGGDIYYGYSLGNLASRHGSLTSEQNSGFKVKTNESSPQNSAKYTPTHEYGHMITFAMYNRDIKSGNWNRLFDGNFDTWCAHKRNEVIRLAQSKYGYNGGEIGVTPKGKISKSKKAVQAQSYLAKSLSKYGSNDPAEFFSEGFVQGNLGTGAIGMAVKDWFKSNL